MKIRVCVTYAVDVDVDVFSGMSEAECFADEGARVAKLAPLHLKTANYGGVIGSGFLRWEKSGAEIFSPDGSPIHAVVRTGGGC